PHISASTSPSALVVKVDHQTPEIAAVTRLPKQVKQKSDKTGHKGVVEKKNVDLIGELAPEYPWRSRMLGEEGEVVVMVSVSKEGVPVHAQVTKSSGHQRLDQAAISAVHEARYTVHEQENDLAQLNLTINFKLREQKP